VAAVGVENPFRQERGEHRGRILTEWGIVDPVDDVASVLNLAVNPERRCAGGEVHS
jgi:hypothetical protein